MWRHAHPDAFLDEIVLIILEFDLELLQSSTGFVACFLYPGSIHLNPRMRRCFSSLPFQRLANPSVRSGVTRSKARTHHSVIFLNCCLIQVTVKR
jgi:hypothetical protein